MMTNFHGDTLERIKLINDLYSDKIEILYTDINDGIDKQGTIVEIKIKTSESKKAEKKI